MYQYLQMEFSPEGLALLKQWEGLRLRAYQDTGGVWTIGYGHIETAKPGMEITERQAEELLLDYDLPKYEQAVNRYVKVTLSQLQFDALVVFCYNVGIHAFKTSTLLKVLNREEYEDVDDQYMRWVYDNGERIEGLVNRREASSALFNRGIFTEDKS